MQGLYSLYHIRCLVAGFETELVNGRIIMKLFQGIYWTESLDVSYRVEIILLAILRFD